MLRSMFTAISSLNLHQHYMDVVADNLANVNTPTFKASRVSFQDQFAQVLWNGSAPTSNLGGVNPAQVGLGVRLGAILPNFTQGILQNTGRDSDLAIEGDGFFIYDQNNAQYFSRDGVLSMDSEGYLVNASSGMRIQGWQAVTSGSSATVNTSSALSSIQLPLGAMISRPTSKATLNGNLQAVTSGSASYTATVGAYDSLGALHSTTITFTHSDTDPVNSWSWSASGVNTSGSGTIAFTQDGQFSSGNSTTNMVTITSGSSGAAPVTINLDFSSLTQLATDTDISVGSQDGLAAGAFTGFSVAPKSGDVYGVYSNGMQNLIGRIALATFINPQGLSRLGQNMYQVGPNSGNPNIGAAGAGGRGTFAPGNLEGSNVDLGQEFTNMILAQRGFQASSRIINTSDEMLQELVNLKR